MNGFLAEHVENGLQALQRLRRSAGNQGQHALGGKIGSSKNMAGHKGLARLGVRGGESPDDLDAVGAAHHVNGVLWQAFQQPSGRKDQRFQRFIVGEHGYDHIPAGGHFRQAAGDGRTCRAQVLKQRRNQVVDHQIVAVLKDSGRHSMAHAPQADKADFH